MNKNSQSGFGVVEVLLVLVIIGIIGFTGWRVYEANREVSNVPVDNSTVETSTLPKGYKEYTNTQYKFSFAYPETWIDQKVDTHEDAWQAGTLVAFVSPEQEKIFKDFMALGRQTEGPAGTSVAVSRWSDMNNSNAKGGEWIDQKKYTSLADYVNDPYEGKPKQKTGEITIDGQKAYEVILGGIGQCYGVMFERNDGIYQIAFPAISEKKDLTPQARQIIDSFKFN